MTDSPMPPKTDEKPGFRQDGAKPEDKNRPENQQGALNERLDDALEETFPSSDPVSVKITK
ncbi:MAG TPA: hypothetical protein VF641_01565 [Methylobacterium sp.]|jgi:hypothetical protein